jgi:hypothetical protein
MRLCDVVCVLKTLPIGLGGVEGPGDPEIPLFGGLFALL